MKPKHIRSILIILVISIIFTFFFDMIGGQEPFSIIGFSMNILYGVIIGASIAFSGVIASFISRKLNAEEKPVSVYVILLITVFVFITIDVFAINILWYRYVHEIPYEKLFRSTGLLITSLITIFIGLTIFFIILSRVYMTKFIEAEGEKQKAQNDAATARFETLKSQINPHFLFNSLNTLSTLIHIDTDRADKFTTHLSNIYRYVLDCQDEELVPVDDEMNFANKYAYLQSIRFNNNFTIEFQEYNGSEPNPMIVPLSLQLLLENVFKHNIISKSKPVKISILYEGDYLVVRNNKNIGKELKFSHSVGLSNILNRYELVSDKDVIIEDTSNYFTVKLPLIYAD